MESLTVKSYAKVNFGLRVVGRREDGYHDIETVLQSISVADSLKVELTEGGVEVCGQNPEMPKGESNLAYQAADRFLRHRGGSFGARITIDKVIPVGAGLGGASSNAASVLLGLNSLTGRRLSSEDLFSTGKELGSDVPFFLHGGTVLATGRGEILDLSLPTTSLWLVLVYPNFPISTKWAYSKIDLSSNLWDEDESGQVPQERVRFLLTEYAFSANMMVRAIRDGVLSEIASNLRNSFEDVVFESYPQLRRIKEELASLGVLGASLSGTGSSLFGICEGESSAQRISSCLEESGHWVRVARTLSREEVLWA